MKDGMITPLFKDNPSPMWVISKDSLRILECNKAAEETYGYNRRQFLEMRFIDLQPEAKVSDIFESSKATSETFDLLGTIDHEDKLDNVFPVKLFNTILEFGNRDAFLIKAVPLESGLEEVQLFDKKEEELNYHLSNSSLAYFIWDDNFHLKIFSKKITDWLGFTEEDLLGKSSTQLAIEQVKDSDFPEVKRKIDALLSGKQKNNEMRFGLTDKYGQTKYLHFYNSALLNKEGKLVSVLSLAEDTTDFVNSQKIQKRQRELIQNTSHFVGLTDEEGQVEYINPAGKEMLGIPEKIDVTDTQLADYHPDEIVTHLKEEIFQQANKWGVWEGELTYTAWNGNNIPTSAVVTAHKNQADKVEYYSTISRNISAEKQYEKELKARQQKLELAIEGGDVGFWQYFPKEQKLEIDDHWLKEKLGYNREVFQEISIWNEIIHPDDWERVKKNFTETATGLRNSFKEEVRIQKAGGSYCWILSKAKVVERDSHGDPKKMSGLQLDIQQQKRNERQLQREKDLHHLLSEISLQIADAKNLQESFQTCIDQICCFLSWPLGHICLFCDQSDELASRSIWNSASEGRFEYFKIQNHKERFTSGEGLMGEALMAEEPRWISELPELDLYNPQDSNEDILRSCIAIPIHVHGEPSAVIEFYHTQKRSRDELLLRNLKIIAQQLGYLLERKMNQEKLHKQEKKFRYIAENAMDKISIYDKEGNCTYATPSTESLLGFTPEEFKELNITDQIHPDDMDRACQNYIAMQEGRKQTRLRYRLQRKDGQYIYVETNFRAFHNEDGDMTELHTTTRNISERVEYEQKLKQESKFIDKALDSLPGLFYMLDENGNFLRFNDGIVQEFGYSKEEAKQMGLMDFFYKEDQERMAQVIEKAFSDGYAEAVARLKKKGRTNDWYHLTGAHFTQNGENYILGTGINITKRKYAEKQLKEQRNLLAKLFDNAPVGIAMVDSKNEILDVNNAFECIFGYSDDNIRGLNIDHLITPEEYKGDAKENFREQIDQDKSSQYKSVRLKKNGTEVPVLIGLVPVVRSEDENLYYRIYVDITERQMHLDKIEKSLDEKRVLLQEIHHRVKNNLAIISGLLLLEAMNWEEDSTVHNVLMQSKLRIHSMAKIHEKLYDSTDFSNIKLDDYFPELIETIFDSMQAQEKGVLVNIDCDEVRLNINQALPCALILNELVTQALKYTFEDHPAGKLEVKLKENNGHFTLIVVDNGPPLPEDFESMIETSLGHRLVSQLVKQLEGEIKVESSDISGTHYEITFQRMNKSGSASNLS